jgi:hypothetical protein
MRGISGLSGNTINMVAYGCDRNKCDVSIREGFEQYRQKILHKIISSNSWINIEEKEPEGDLILCYDIEENRFFIAFFKESKKPGWYLEYDGTVATFNYWIPIPKLPLK